METSKFHPGEIKVQQLAGEEKMAQRVQRVLQNSILLGAMDFMTDQPFVVVSSMDKEDRLWASILFGSKGLITVHGTKSFGLNLKHLLSNTTDIFFENITTHPEIGSLFINHGLRIRYRVNGSVMQTGRSIDISVDEAYGNCPKYIQASAFSIENSNQVQSPEISEGEVLSDTQLQLIKGAHTFYLATRSKGGRMDASHRGGNPGFIEILDGNLLRIPDYPGNSMFNSLGNIQENPNTGLLFVDFDQGSTLQLTGKASLQFEQNDGKSLEKSGNTGRFWLFEPEKWISTENQHMISHKFMEFSPFNP